MCGDDLVPPITSEKLNAMWDDFVEQAKVSRAAYDAHRKFWENPAWKKPEPITIEDIAL